MYSIVTQMVLNCTGEERQRMLELRITQLDAQYDELGEQPSMAWILESPSTPEANRTERLALALALGKRG